MPILTMQQRARELGRIRIGKQVTKNGRSRPEKLDSFRVTSSAKELIEKVAQLYGGTVEPWKAPAGEQWEVVTDVKRLPVLVPPQPVTQWFEVWSGGGIVRRCDGIDEQVSGGSCLCSAEDMTCKPTTRLSVMLADVAALGLWRLESHGWYAAQELPGLAQFLASATDYVPAWLGLEARQIKKPDEKYPRNFMVPTIEVEQTPAALLSGLAAKRVPSPGELPITVDKELPQGPDPRQKYVEGAEAAQSLDVLKGIWQAASRAGVLDGDLKAFLTERADELDAARAEEDKTELVSTLDPNELWVEIVRTAPDGMTSSELEAQFKEKTGVDAGEAGAREMLDYLRAVGLR